jgi:lysozyme
MKLPEKLTVATVAASLAMAAPLALPMIGKWESAGVPRLKPYLDIAGNPTVCDGETRVAMRTYTLAECRAMTQRAYYEFGAQVLGCTPWIYDRPAMVAAAVVITYNIGVPAYCGSSMARAFKARRWADGCDAFLLWKRAGGRVVPGLLARRRDEQRLCMEGV